MVRCSGSEWKLAFIYIYICMCKRFVDLGVIITENVGVVLFKICVMLRYSSEKV